MAFRYRRGRNGETPIANIDKRMRFVILSRKRLPRKRDVEAGR
jgi:hypothetical protein